MEDYISRLKLFEKPDLGNVEEPTSEVYFYDPHAHPSTHEILMKDEITMTVFQGWIQDNSELIRDQVVLDVGCGTGWLSILAAKAGAARVISLEWSHIVNYTEKIVKDNNLDHKITVIKGNVKNVELPHGINKVDVIISQWIGCCLFQGGCIKKVLEAKDRWLKSNGIIIPDRATLFISGISDDEFRENRIVVWKNVYGFDMSVIVDDLLRQAQQNTALPPEKMVTNLCKVKEIDLISQNYDEITAEVPFALTAKRNDFIQGYCTFFTVRFSLDCKKRELTTDPRKHPTHWGQTCFYFRDFFKIKKKELMTGSFSVFGVNDDQRFLGIVIGTCFKGELDDVVDIKSYVLRS